SWVCCSVAQYGRSHCHRTRCPMPKRLRWSAAFMPPQDFRTNLVFATSKPREVAMATYTCAAGLTLTTRLFEAPNRRSSERYRLGGSHQAAWERPQIQTRKLRSNVTNTAYQSSD